MDVPAHELVCKQHEYTKRQKSLTYPNFIVTKFKMFQVLQMIQILNSRYLVRTKKYLLQIHQSFQVFNFSYPVK